MECLGFNDAIQMRNISEMTPAELAHVNGHFELANKLHALHVQIYKEWNQQHVYDYIQVSPKKNCHFECMKPVPK